MYRHSVNILELSCVHSALVIITFVVQLVPGSALFVSLTVAGGWLLLAIIIIIAYLITIDGTGPR